MRHLRSRLKLNYSFILLVTWLILTPVKASGQGPISGFMSGRHHTDFALSYGKESYNQYKLGDMSREVEQVVSFANLFIEHGFSDTLSLVLTVPYLHYDEEHSGIQDGALHLKYRNAYHRSKRGASTVVTAVGLRTPLTGYSTGERFSIGAQTTTLEGRLVWQYTWFNTGIFIHLQSGLDFQVTPEARAAMPLVLRTGWSGDKWYFEGWLDGYRAFEPNVERSIGVGSGSRWWRLGATAYYGISKQWGILLSGAKIVSGRNIGLATRLNTGVVFKWNR